MELYALSLSERLQKLLPSIVVLVTAVFLSSFFYSKQLYRTSFYVLVIIGFCIAITRSIALLKNGYAFPWKCFFLLSGVCVGWFLYIAFTIGANTGFAESGAMYALYFILFLFLFFVEEKQEKLLYLAFLVVSVSALLSAQLNGMTLSSFEDMGSKFSKYLLIAGLVPLYRYIKIKNSQIIVVISFASFFIGAMALVDFWQFDFLKVWLFDESNNWGGRAAGNSTPARFGTIGACFFCICIAYLSHKEKRTLLEKYLLVVAVGFSFMSVLFSQSRGPWVAVLLFMFLMFWFLPGYSKRAKMLIALVFIIVASLIFQFDFVKDRIHKALDSYEAYVQTEDHLSNERATAVGLRLELWRASYVMFAKSPVFGMGAGNYKSELKEIVNNGEYHPKTLLYHSAHNQYLSALSGRGVIGIIATLMLFGVCFLSFVRQTSIVDSMNKPPCTFGGVAVVVIYATSGMTHETLDQKYLLVFFLVCVSIFYAAVRANANDDSISAT